MNFLSGVLTASNISYRTGFLSYAVITTFARGIPKPNETAKIFGR